LEAGVLLTSAEELGLAGARAWAAAQRAERAAGVPPSTPAINVDGVDDVGVLRLVYTREKPGRLLAALHGAARRVGTEARSAPLLPGVLLDGVALADAGWEVITVSKGTLRTVARVHTPRDSAAHLSGRGIAEAAQVIASAIPELD
ncbi:MAG: M28 family peptidase, partial [Gemmatimonadaceae bacterium]